MRNSSWISSSAVASFEIIIQRYYGNRINYINNSDCWCPLTHTGEVNYKKECHHAFSTSSTALAFIRWTEHGEKDRNMMGPSASNNYGCACFWFLIEKILVDYTYIISLLYLLVPHLQTEPTVDWTYLSTAALVENTYRPYVARGRNGQCGSFNRSIPSRRGYCLECGAWESSNGKMHPVGKTEINWWWMSGAVEGVRMACKPWSWPYVVWRDSIPFAWIRELVSWSEPGIW